ncbi:hypothetical protein A1O3_00815 [Capronia epimyces CBS 606.96]|uniref:Heterokaryon incompatibility domain-containing protein n=1 Tax=Capronia epimyces CBS 606.96 TaxID=1182542 RepID=W9YRF6_9EURO|nr:uncharacterized protein A1O3_00815 [Capronia epimyces CBS 606.96]EXJ92265.1 hypothetical protein A1O3_00815 [Capronia epimyces CBS 606.96]
MPSTSSSQEQVQSPYDALSYVWTGEDRNVLQPLDGEGDSAASSKVPFFDKSMHKLVPLLTSDFRVIPITETLHHALLHIRHPTENRALWVDQLCISQQHPWELAIQVPNMYRIFGGARSVICWLGHVKPEIRTLMQWAEELENDHSTAKLPQTEQSPDEEPTTFVPAGPMNVLVQILSREIEADTSTDMSDRLRTVLNGYLNLAWPTRAWTFQEAVVCPRTIIQYGSSAVKFDAFITVVDVLYHMAFRHESAPDHQFQTALTNGVDSLAMVASLRSIVEEWEQGHTDMSLRWLLTRARQRVATDDRDKVYSIYGLLNMLKPAEWNISATNYDTPVSHVYQAATVDCMNREQNLDMLSRCCAGNDAGHNYKLPSWVEDWSVTQPLCPRPIFSTYFRTQGSSRAVYGAASRHAPEVTYLDRAHGLLRVKGIIFDTVERVVSRKPEDALDADELIQDGIPAATFAGQAFPPIPSGSQLKFHITVDMLARSFPADGDSRMAGLLRTLRADLEEIWSEWIELALAPDLPDPYGGHSQRLGAFWRALVEDLDLASGAQLERLPLEFDEQVQGWVEATGSATGSGTGTGTAPATGKTCQWTLSDEASAFYDKYYATWMARRLYRTRKGYLGLSCDYVRPGDKVALLYGGSLPFLLRRQGTINFRGRGPNVEVEAQGTINFRGSGPNGEVEALKSSSVASYVLIGGETYVHGLADGQGLDIAVQEDMAAEEIYLL